MESTTLSRLRNAALDALAECDDASAYELLNLIVQQPSVAPTPALSGSCRQPPALPPVAEPGDAHDYHFWARLIRDSFLPFMQEYGRRQFTSPELFSWLEARELPLTTGDLNQHSTGREVWRNQISMALRKLKTTGVLSAGTFGRVYTIQNTPALPAKVSA